MHVRTVVNLSEHLDKTPEGYLLCREAALGRTGVMRYLPEEVSEDITEGFAGKEVLVYRDDSEVFSPEALASFEGKPLTLDHPDEDVAPENWAELARGIVTNVRRGTGPASDLVLADILVTDAEAIAAIEGGLRELSCGYDAEVERIRPGVGRQTHIRGNHVALVDHGRAGGRCKIKDEDTSMAKGKGKKVGWADRLRRLLKDAEAEEAAAKAADEETPAPADEDTPGKDEEQAPATTDDDVAASLEEIKLLLRTLVEALKPQGGGDDAPKDAEPEGAQDEESCEDEEPGAPQDEDTGAPARDRRPKRQADADMARRARGMGLAGACPGDNADAVRRGALALAMRDAASASLVRDILGDKPLSRASSAELAAAFGAVAAVTAAGNNRRTADSLTRPATGAPKVWTPADINKANAAFYGKGGNNG